MHLREVSFWCMRGHTCRTPAARVCRHGLQCMRRMHRDAPAIADDGKLRRHDILAVPGGIHPALVGVRGGGFEARRAVEGHVLAAAAPASRLRVVAAAVEAAVAHDTSPANHPRTLALRRMIAASTVEPIAAASRHTAAVHMHVQLVHHACAPWMCNSSTCVGLQTV